MRNARVVDASASGVSAFRKSHDTIQSLEDAHFRPSGERSATTAEIISSTLSELNDVRSSDSPLLPLFEDLIVLCSRLDARVTQLDARVTELDARVTELENA